jgi:hypothetical protein
LNSLGKTISSSVEKLLNFIKETSSLLYINEVLSPLLEFDISNPVAL